MPPDFAGRATVSILLTGETLARKCDGALTIDCQYSTSPCERDTVGYVSIQISACAGEITLRGDTDFTLSAELDRWISQGIKFLVRIDAILKVVKVAEALPLEAWEPLNGGSAASVVA